MEPHPTKEKIVKALQARLPDLGIPGKPLPASFQWSVAPYRVAPARRSHLRMRVSLLQMSKRFGEELFVGVPELFGNILTVLLQPAHIRATGIFRTSGSQSSILALKDELEAGRFECLKKAAVHDVAGVLTHFLRELPTPLIPEQVRSDFFGLLTSRRMSAFWALAARDRYDMSCASR